MDQTTDTVVLLQSLEALAIERNQLTMIHIAAVVFCGLCLVWISTWPVRGKI